MPLRASQKLGNVVHSPYSLVKESTQRKLDYLSHLMKKAGASELIQTVEHDGHLQAYDCDQMASCI